MSGLQPLVDAIMNSAARRERTVVAIAGAPGAGKSTLAQALRESLPPASAKILPMDGFHYDNLVLDALGLRARKGAPETFDFDGFRTTLQRIRLRERNVAIPIFERELDLARAGADIVGDVTPVIIVEGNYLLLDEDPWSSLAGSFDLSVFLAVAKDELHRRLLKRWIDLGYPAQQAADWVLSNDMPNAERVLLKRRKADIVWPFSE